MKIRILTNCYPPEIGAASNQLFELAQALTAAGHNVSVVTRFPRHVPKEIAPPNDGKWLVREKRPEADVVRVNIPHLPRRIPLMREFEHFLNFMFLVLAARKSQPAEVSLVYSPPIVVGYAAIIIRLFEKSKVVLNVQDLFPQSLIDLGVLKNKWLIIISRFLEKNLYQRVDHITVMSEKNKEIVDKTSGDNSKVSVVYNWVDTDYILPGERNNEFRREFGLGDKFVLSFAGCIAESQDMDIILESAKALEKYEDIQFLLAGNGPRYDYTVNKSQEMMLKNVIIIPIQPREKYVKLLAASDVALVTLNPLVATPVVPSKILSIMSAARPVLASLPLSGDAPKIIERAQCGLVVAAGDREAFKKSILKLYQDAQLRREYGEKGRNYVVNNFSLKVCAGIYEKLFEKIVKNGK